MDPELKALGHVAFRTAYAGNDIWRDDVIHVDGIHSWAFERDRERRSPGCETACRSATSSSRGARESGSRTFWDASAMR